MARRRALAVTAEAVTSRYKRYPAYRDSGVEWLGEIPDHWEARRLKDSASLNVDSLPEDSDPDLEIVYVDIGGVNDRGRIEQKEALRFAAAPSRARRRVRHGDVIVSTVRTYLRAIASIVAPEPNLVVSTGFAVVTPQSLLDASFAAYAMRAPYFVERVVANSVGVSYPAINESALATFRLAVPPLCEQVQIASFLDREITKIDALIGKKERLLEVLDERSRAAITVAVTRGLDPTASVKTSGFNWPREVPVHWRAERIKWAAKLDSGHTPDKKVPAYWQDGDVPWVSLADTGRLRLADYITDTEVSTTSAGLENSSAHLLPAASVVFSRDATIGLCAILARPMAVSQHFISLTCGPDVIPEYLLAVLRAMTSELGRFTMGATVKTIGMPDVKELAMPIPPLKEQRQIVDVVQQQRAALGQSAELVGPAIRSLTALRSALISAAVTGKIDVREEVA
jgi:type I restriction enzyme S subunit